MRYWLHPLLPVLTEEIQYSQQALKFVYYPTFETLFVVSSHIKGRFLSMTCENNVIEIPTDTYLNILSNNKRIIYD